MKTILSALLVSSAVAFAPATTKSTPSNAVVLSESKFASEVGAMPPLGFFDPLGVVEDGDAENFSRWREIELKHGRVAMLAITGYLYTLAGNRLPGMEEVGSGFKAFDVANLSPEVRGVFPLTLFTILCLEFYVMTDITGDSQFPGDFRNGFDFGWDKQTDEWKRNKRNIELNNGRAAQMGIAGIMIHELMGNLSDLGSMFP
mmetsp:Transcript_35614/g.77983  ORF Transcript_35614/g.77983 Transcript_35614/m.77983 type:complete len:202 (+) Transcript_35614:113-718(+)